MKRSRQKAFSITDFSLDVIHRTVNFVKSYLPSRQPKKNEIESTSKAIVEVFSLPDTRNRIFNFLSPDQITLRVVCKGFLNAWNDKVKDLYSIPTHPKALINNSEYDSLFANQQRTEIEYLMENKEEILRKNLGDSIQNAFLSLQSLSCNDTLVAIHFKEQCLNLINESIIKNKINKEEKILDCQSCHLTRFPSTLFSDETLANFWTQLQSLDISCNQITALPANIGKLNSLQCFYVWGNKLATLPSTIGELTALQLLILSHNQLAEVPSTIGHLKEIKRLEMDNNLITALPESISQLTSVVIFNVANNMLRVLPETISQCLALERLIVIQNQLSSLPNKLPEEILHDSLRKITKDKCLATQKKPDYAGQNSLKLPLLH